ncbi:MAG TPA: hypothetical protein VFE47_21510 [Tepidisphaeraceae bacterium]|jgi:hypothetical protein|nr:hypothetical protein [Tepidisphaeraceae bacterium]
MALFLPILFAVVVGGWALLTLVGGERTRRLNEFDAIQAAAKPPPPKEVTPVAKSAIAAPAKPAVPAKPAAKAEAKPKPETKAKPKGK